MQLVKWLRFLNGVAFHIYRKCTFISGKVWRVQWWILCPLLYLWNIYRKRELEIILIECGAYFEGMACLPPRWPGGYNIYPVIRSCAASLQIKMIDMHTPLLSQLQCPRFLFLDLWFLQFWKWRRRSPYGGPPIHHMWLWCRMFFFGPAQKIKDPLNSPCNIGTC